ncbi:MAG: hypothetical protein ACKPE6_01790, partial [Gammaproteobacteria bacterium]
CFVLLCLCVLVYACYLPGLGFGLAFDDVSNLVGLSGVGDFSSAMLFVFSGEAGPWGRPLSLASFALQASDWPDNLAAFVRVNIALHLLNALVLAALVRKLAPHVRPAVERSWCFGIVVAALWASSPLLMSTSLMPVQRMTSLSAHFALLGLLGWICARELLSTRPWRALAGMSAAVAAGTAAAALSKETGALLPLFIMVLEFTLLRSALPWPRLSPLQERAWRLWRLAVFGLPILGILRLGWAHLSDIDAAYAGFGYGPLDRLLTEAGVLFSYIRQLLLPVRSGLGPFHDDVQVAASLSGFILLLCWLAVGLLSWRLRQGRLRVFSFAIAWFLVGHVLESTIFPLEPYFEHRNYLPSVGIWIGVCALLWRGAGRLRLAGPVLLGVLVLNNFFVLRETGLVWSDPVIAGRIWHEEHPDSLRALVQYGRSLGESGRIDQSIEIYDAASERLKATPQYQAGRLQLYCATDRHEGIPAAASALEQTLATGRIDYHVPDSIRTVMGLVNAGRCKGFDSERGRRMLEYIASSGESRVMPRARLTAHMGLADHWTAQRELDPAVRHLESAWQSSGDMGVLRLLVRVFISADLCEEARKRLQGLDPLLPANPLLRPGWRLQRDGIADDVARGCSSAANAKDDGVDSPKP